MSTLTPTMKLVAPDVNDKKGKTIEDLAANFQYLDALFPIGTIYESTKPTNPGTFRGGTWTPLDGRVLVGAGTTFPAGTTGGYKQLIGKSTVFGYRLFPPMGSVGGDSTGVHDHGDGAADSNMPPYRSVYMWERTA